jgi:hypothetical protein
LHLGMEQARRFVYLALHRVNGAREQQQGQWPINHNLSRSSLLASSNKDLLLRIKRVTSVHDAILDILRQAFPGAQSRRLARRLPSLQTAAVFNWITVIGRRLSTKLRPYHYSVQSC